MPPRDAATQKLYGREAWRKKARAQLKREPLCRLCGKHGLVVPATCADHIIPHHGNEESFWHGELQSLCKPCHSRSKQVIEKRGYAKDVGADGLPLDPLHPFYQVKYPHAYEETEKKGAGGSRKKRAR